MRGYIAYMYAIKASATLADGQEVITAVGAIDSSRILDETELRDQALAEAVTNMAANPDAGFGIDRFVYKAGPAL